MRLNNRWTGTVQPGAFAASRPSTRKYVDTTSWCIRRQAYSVKDSLRKVEPIIFPRMYQQATKKPHYPVPHDTKRGHIYQPSRGGLLCQVGSHDTVFSAMDRIMICNPYLIKTEVIEIAAESDSCCPGVLCRSMLVPRFRVSQAHATVLCDTNHHISILVLNNSLGHPMIAP
jgi:hypothetical protein